MTEALEKEAADNDLRMGIANNIFTIFIELSQNMMNYSKSKNETNKSPGKEGLIIVGKDAFNNYYIHSQNIISLEDKEKVEKKLATIMTLDKAEIKKKYRELRREGSEKHSLGAGIGFYEIAKRCEKFNYDFERINAKRFYFTFKTFINTN
ncbi:MAG: hypothetical protein COA66_06145 [Arcobacter sp.]|nr:MAG: hypothetical protein COA66_06145 [Arcobacter sp.]